MIFFTNTDSSFRDLYYNIFRKKVKFTPDKFLIFNFGYDFSVRNEAWDLKLYIHGAMEGRKGFTISARLVAAAVAALIVLSALATSFFSVDQTENAVVLRLGRYARTVGPGLQTKLPFGIERSYNVETAVVQTLTFGYRATDPSGTSLSGAYFNPDESMMLTGDLNIVSVEWIVQYRIGDPRKYLFSIRTRRPPYATSPSR